MHAYKNDTQVYYSHFAKTSKSLKSKRQKKWKREMESKIIQKLSIVVWHMDTKLSDIQPLPLLKGLKSNPYFGEAGMYVTDKVWDFKEALVYALSCILNLIFLNQIFPKRR